MRLLNEQHYQRPQQSLPVEIVSPEHSTRYQIGSRVEILKIFKEMLKERVFIRAFFSNHKQSFLTGLIEINRDKNRLILDAPVQEDLKKRIGKEGPLTLSTTVDRILVQFDVKIVGQGTFNGLPVFYAKIPRHILRLQRREYYRLVTPLATPIFCDIPKEEAFDTFEVYDVGIGGVAILDAPVTEVGTILPNVRFELPDEGWIRSNLVVRYIHEVTMRSGTVVRRIGCAFEDVTGAMQNMIQRYILRTEREKKAREQFLLE